VIPEAIESSIRRRTSGCSIIGETDATDPVTLAECAVGVHIVTGHDEKRDALRASWSTGDASQNQVDDVVGHIVFAPGDEDFGACDLPAAVITRYRPGANGVHIRTSVELSEIHGAGPFTCHETR